MLKLTEYTYKQSSLLVRGSTMGSRLLSSTALRSFDKYPKRKRDDESGESRLYNRDNRDSGDSFRGSNRDYNRDNRSSYRGSSGYGNNRYQDRNSGGYNGGRGGYNGGRGGYNGGRSGGFNSGSQGGGRFQRNPKSRADEADDLALIRRTKGSRNGPEGDGLRGLDNYEVDIDSKPEFQWTDLKTLVEPVEGEPQEEVTLKPGFSGISTLALAEHQLASRVLVNSLFYNRKYEEMTSVQAQTFLPILRGESVVVRAKTGTGKTAAFAVPTIQRVLEAKRRGVEGVKAVIVSPTRELAQQIAEEILAITQYGEELRKIRTACFVGGLSKRNQIREAFESGPPCDIMVATPGRLLDILDDPFVVGHFKNLNVKILDEADRLLDTGFSRELDKIRGLLDEATGGANIATLLFSATIDKRVRDFAKAEFGGKVKIVDTVSKDEPEAQELVDQSVVLCNNWRDVYAASVQSIQREIDLAAKSHGSKDFKAIVFLPTVKLVDHFKTTLATYFKTTAHKIRANAIHGQMTQSARQRVADQFRKSKESVLITTDVIARGMDFPLVSHVFQLGSPSDVPSYIHRIGRTARIGNSGKSILMIDRLEKNYLRNLRQSNITNFTESDYEADAGYLDDKILQDAAVVDDPSEANSLFNSLLAAAGQNRSSLDIPAKEYISAQESFKEFIGLEDARLSGPVRDLWAGRQRSQFSSNFKRSGRGSFGANSRKTRMRF